MGVTISVDALSSTIQGYLKELGDKADKALDLAGKMTAEQAVQTLKELARKAGKRERLENTRAVGE